MTGALWFVGGVVVGAVVFGMLAGPRTGSCCAALNQAVSDKISSKFGAAIASIAQATGLTGVATDAANLYYGSGG